MKKSVLNKIRRNLNQQYNEQNDGSKPEYDEKYIYLLTEIEFDAIIDMATELLTLKEILGEKP